MNLFVACLILNQACLTGYMACMASLMACLSGCMACMPLFMACLTFNKISVTLSKKVRTFKRYCSFLTLQGMIFCNILTSFIFLYIHFKFNS